MSTRIDLILDQGADFLTVFNVQAANGSPVDLSSYTAASQMRTDYLSNTFIQFIMTTNANGDVTMNLPSANTIPITPGRYKYDVEITSPGNVVSRIVEGIIDVSPNMTR